MFTTTITSRTTREREHAYEAWRLAADQAAAALNAWTVGPEDDRLGAFVAYAAALDREEQAAQALAHYTEEQAR